MKSSKNGSASILINSLAPFFLYMSLYLTRKYTKNPIKKVAYINIIYNFFKKPHSSHNKFINENIIIRVKTTNKIIEKTNEATFGYLTKYKLL